MARTDPDVPKHEGLTFFIVDMTSPGIEVRPLVQAQGVAHFNEVFFSDLRIPAANVVGEAGGGWKVTRTTLRSESSTLYGVPLVPEMLRLSKTVPRCRPRCVMLMPLRIMRCGTSIRKGWLAVRLDRCTNYPYPNSRR